MWFQGQDTQEMGVWLDGTFVENSSGNGIKICKEKYIGYDLISEANGYRFVSEAMSRYMLISNCFLNYKL